MSSCAALEGLEGLEKRMNQNSRYKTLYLGLTWAKAKEMGMENCRDNKSKKTKGRNALPWQIIMGIDGCWVWAVASLHEFTNGFK